MKMNEQSRLLLELIDGGDTNARVILCSLIAREINTNLLGVLSLLEELYKAGFLVEKISRELELTDKGKKYVKSQKVVAS